MGTLLLNDSFFRKYTIQSREPPSETCLSLSSKTFKLLLSSFSSIGTIVVVHLSLTDNSIEHYTK